MRYRWVGTIGVALMLLLSSCSSGDAQPSGAGDQVAPTASGGVAMRVDPEGENLDSAAASSGSSSPAGESIDSAVGDDAVDDEGAGADAGAGNPGDRLPPPNLPTKPKVPVEASVRPACVEPGGTIKLKVKTRPEAAIGWQAVYSDGRGGGGAPFGAGYGGNDKGYASKSGVYSSTWVVSPTAPEGAGRVDVVIGFEGELGYDDPHFAVAENDGDCPEKWLEDGE